jgi:hypothetical protein
MADLTKHSLKGRLWVKPEEAEARIETLERERDKAREEAGQQRLHATTWHENWGRGLYERLALQARIKELEAVVEEMRRVREIDEHFNKGVEPRLRAADEVVDIVARIHHAASRTSPLWQALTAYREASK